MAFILVSETSPRSLRSHVMQGKNRARPRPDRRRRLEISIEALKTAYNTIPPRLGSELSCTELAAVDPRLFGRLMEFTSLSVRVLFPLAVLTDFPVHEATWLDYLRQDTALLHLMLFAADVFIETAVEKTCVMSNRARRHFISGVSLVRQQLKNQEVSDLMVRKVLILALCAHLMGDVATAQHHLRGLHCIIDLRGGISSFQRQKLFFETVRSDIALAVQYNCEPMFSEALELYPSDETNITEPIYGLDQQLHIVWSSMHHFCAIANLAGENKTRISPVLLQETMTSVMYRLLKMRFAADSRDEAVRLALLSFTSHVFLQGQDSLFPPLIAPKRFPCLKDIQPDLRLWLLFIEGFAGSERRTCLQATLGECGLSTWRETREVLKRFLWIDILYERRGKLIFSTK
ncbi:hypothetical protein ASPZODRAFT_139460 [Penicilliopsis zonata CBS 506.65]|uniref:Zn(II)2Cys6 transcription factor n=1 Tax=Penicilliopsis zonata CBS 506.65 TaxID=1073090 RepID=A0A1L9SSI6_9EURO|nr:hypothetical protein ASPZODRAFT_139460 [Penicilliopsis zonata CBS 506.65]OJJ50139.1 hypothetical protein ASPZODRAFT_139460 [Penicilliopsis zonata CBS 506.65]